MRDSRIFMIYEGTNGIQAMDLLGRKLAMNKGQSFTYFLDQIRKTIQEALLIDGLSVLAEKMELALDRYDVVAHEIGARARSEMRLTPMPLPIPFWTSREILSLHGCICGAPALPPLNWLKKQALLTLKP